MIQIDTLIYTTQCIVILYSTQLACGLSKYDKNDLHTLREEVRHMFQHAYDSYLNYAYPYDELRPLSCDGVDTWGSYSLTLIDALDTLAVMGNYTEFQRVVNIVTANANFDANINVSVFETNIRIIGGLLSAHLMSHRAGVEVVPGWPCNGPLLQLAEDVARRLIAAFDTPTGMPYGTVNLRHGVPPGETTVTCTAGVGTFILEFGTLSRLTGDPLFEEVAMNALNALYHHHSPIGLVGNHIDVATGRWTAQDAGIGAGVDSYYEYLAKGAILLQRPELMHMFNKGKSAIEKYLKRDDWHLWVSMMKGQVTLPVFQSLEAYWPGVLSLIGDVQKGMKSLHNYHQVWKQYGFTPEFYYIPQGEVGINRESYPLRPELIESVMYMYRVTGDPYLLDVGRDILHSIQHSARTPCGYATIKDVRDHRKEDRMESFFLAETTKYLYLLFDPDNFIHNRGQTGTVIKTPWGECILDAGGYIFNTEAHPIDPGALNCCSGSRKQTMQPWNAFQDQDWALLKGDPLSSAKKHKPVQDTGHQSPDPSESFSADEANLKSNELPPTRLKNEKTEPKAVSDDEILRRGNIDGYLEKIITDLSGAIKVISVQKQLDKAVPEKALDHDASSIPLFIPLEKEGTGKHCASSDKENVRSLAGDVKQSVGVEGKSENYDFGNFQENLDKESQTSTYAQGEAEAYTSDEELEEEEKPDEVDDQYEELETDKIEDSSDSSAETDNKRDEFQGNSFDQAKLDMLEYRADDSDQTYPVSGQVQTGTPAPSSGQLDCVENWSSLNNDVLPIFVRQYLLAKSHTKLQFDPQELFQRIRTSGKYEKNSKWESDYKILSCAAQQFLQRLSLSGEMFEAL